MGADQTADLQHFLKRKSFVSKEIKLDNYEFFFRLLLLHHCKSHLADLHRVLYIRNDLKGPEISDLHYEVQRVFSKPPYRR